MYKHKTKFYSIDVKMRNKIFYFTSVKTRNSKELHPYISYRTGTPPRVKPARIY